MKRKFRILSGKILNRKILLVAALIIVGGGFLILRRPQALQTQQGSTLASKTEVVSIDKSYDFPAISNQGKEVTTRIKLKIANAEITNQVAVKDQVYTAKNKKMFLIVNLELKNDATVPLNIVPGDLIRLTYNGDNENKYAPDLHNNLVLVAAISTKLDRIGFVIPETTRDFILYIGELDGKKEKIEFNFPS